MGYVAWNWPSLKILWILRNPVDVVESMVAMRKAGYGFDWSVESIKSRPELLGDWLAPFLPEMEAAKSLARRLAHRWCIEQFVPLKQGVKDRPNVLPVRYEKLRADRRQWARVMEFLGCADYDAGLLERESLKPSRVSRPGALRRKDRAHLDAGEIEYIKQTVRLYGLESLICDSSMDDYALALKNR